MSEAIGVPRFFKSPRLSLSAPLSKKPGQITMWIRLPARRPVVRLLIEYERPEHVAGCGNYILMAIQRERLWRITDTPDARVPQRFAIGNIVRHQVARTVSCKEQTAGRGE